MPSVILLRPTYDPDSRSAPVFPWALLYLSAVLVERGIDVSIIDEPCTPDCHAVLKRLLAENKPVAVGITSMTGAQIHYGLALAKLVREHSDAAIVWGGIHPSLLPEQTARHPLVDYAIAGEGEYALADLVECLAAGRDPDGIPGLYFERSGEVRGVRRDGYLDLAVLPEIPYDLVDVERYISRRPDLGAERYFEICTSRGCPHHCGFCYIESVHGSRWRSIDADEAVARIKTLVKRYSLDCVSFREDNFFVGRRRVEAIAQGLIDEKVGIRWAASCRINYFAQYSPEFVDLLKRSGCALLTFGVESGSDRVLESIRKGITVEQVLAVARMVHEGGIRGTYHFMGGFPSESEAEFLDTCRLIEQLTQVSADIVVREMSIFAPYPGVGLIPECVARGYREPTDLEAWVAMDWANPQRSWLTQHQARLIGDAQFLIARLHHSNPVIACWAGWRWGQMLRSERGCSIPERSLIEWARSLRGR